MEKKRAAEAGHEASAASDPPGIGTTIVPITGSSTWTIVSNSASLSFPTCRLEVMMFVTQAANDPMR